MFALMLLCCLGLSTTNAIVLAVDITTIMIDKSSALTTINGEIDCGDAKFYLISILDFSRDRAFELPIAYSEMIYKFEDPCKIISITRYFVNVACQCDTFTFYEKKYNPNIINITSSVITYVK